MRKHYHLFVLLFLTPTAGLLAQIEKVDNAAIEKIRQEGLQHSQVMDIAFHLTDASGNRLTASPGFSRAANYAKDQLTKWGLTGAALDPWGEFGKGWELQKSYVALTAPYYKPMIAYPKAWCAGTDGPKSASVLLISAADSAGLDAYKGKLAGKILIPELSIEYKQSFKADATRYTDEQLDSMSKVVMRPVDTAEARRRRGGFNRAAMAMMNTLKAMALKEGAVAILSESPRGHDGTLFVQGGGAYSPDAPANFLDIVVTLEDYMTIVRLLKAGTPVSIDADVKTKFQTADTKGYNVIAEIKGTDPKLKEEVVMLGGHLDSWIRRHRQCRRLYRHDGSRSYPESNGPATPPDHPHRLVERRRRRPAGFPRLCEEDLRRSRHHATPPGP